MTSLPDKKDLSREEDYRDYQERDDRDGWPYSDDSGLGSDKPENRPYGTTGANFDEEPQSGLIGDEAAADGLEEDNMHSLGPLPTDRIDADQLEASITELLIQNRNIAADSIDVRAEGGVVTLDGSVETQALSRKVEALALGTSGVTEVRNRLKTIGIDSHIPGDASP